MGKQLIDIQPVFGGDWKAIKVEREDGVKTRTVIDDFNDYFYVGEDRLDEIKNDDYMMDQVIDIQEETFKKPLFYDGRIYKLIMKGHWCKFKFLKFFNGNLDHVFELDVPYAMRYAADNIKHLEKTNYRTLFFDIETTTDFGFPEYTNAIEHITCISMFDSFEKKYYLYVLKPETWSEKWKELEHRKFDEETDVTFFDDEKEMLNEFLNMVDKKDYDILTAWNSQFDFCYIFGRCDYLKLNKEKISPMGKVVINKKINKQNREEIDVKIEGRFAIDLLQRYKAITFKEVPSYSLDYVTGLELGENDKKKEKVLDFSKEWKEHLDRLIDYSIRDTKVLVELDKKLKLIDYLEELRLISNLPNIEFAAIAKHLIDMSLFREFGSQYVFPSKSGLEKVNLGGGYVFPPVLGVYDWVAVYDFSGMYPSIMRTFNLSKDTIVEDLDKADFVTHEDDVELLPKDIGREGFKTGWSLAKKGMMPTILENIIGVRMAIKKEMKGLDKDSIEWREKNLKQYALKAPINAMYGVNCYNGFRLFEPRVSATITYLGRSLNKYVSKRIEEDFKLPVLYGDSVGKESWIIDKKLGRINIEELWINNKSECYKKGSKEIKKCSNKILTTTDQKKNKFSLCTEIIRHKCKKNMYRVYLTNETYIDVTEDHSLITFNDELHFTESKPTSSSYLLFNRKIPLQNVKSKKLSKEMYEFLGLWIGDGGLHKKTLAISSGLDTDEFIKKILKPLQREGWINSWNICKNNYDVKLNAKKLVKFFEDNVQNGNSFTKQIPKWIFNESEENICNFLRGYFSSDGSGKSGNLGIGSVNKKLLEQTSYLLNLCGIANRIGKDNTGNRYKNSKITSYSYNLSVFYDSKKFMDKIGFLYERQFDKLSKTRGNLIIVPKKYMTKKILGYDSTFIQSRIAKKIVPKEVLEKIEQYDILPRRIVKIEKIEYDDYVYDLCIPETQRFICNNILVHNTDSTMVNLKENNQDLVKQIQDKINDVYVKEFIDRISGGKITNNYINVEYEKTYEKLLLIKKRRYLGKIYNGDWEYKGVDLKRSNTPEIIRECLQKYIDVLFESKEPNMLEITKMLYEKKDQIDLFKIPLKLSKDYQTDLPQKRAAEWANKNLKSNFKQGSKFYGLWVEECESDIIGFTDVEELKDKGIKINMRKYEKILLDKINNLRTDEDEIKNICDIYQTKLF